MKDLNAFIEYSSNMQDVYKRIDECNTSRKYSVSIVFDNMITGMINNKKLWIAIVVELLIVYSITHFFIIKIPNKREFQQIAFNHLLGIGFEEFMDLHKKCTAEQYSLLVIVTSRIILYASNNPLCFRYNFSERILQKKHNN